MHITTNQPSTTRLYDPSLQPEASDLDPEAYNVVFGEHDTVDVDDEVGEAYVNSDAYDIVEADAADVTDTPTDPSSLTIDDLREWAAATTDIDAIEATLAAERDAESRTTAIGLLETRRNALAADDDPAETPDGGDDDGGEE